MKAWSHEDSNRGKKLQQALIESDENQDCVLSFDEFNTVINKVRTVRSHAAAPETNLSITLLGCFPLKECQYIVGYPLLRRVLSTVLPLGAGCSKHTQPHHTQNVEVGAEQQ